MNELEKGVEPKSPRYFDLEMMYEKALNYKDEVLRAWLDSLLDHAFSAAPEHKEEALRRIGYIEDYLISGYKPPPKLKNKRQSHAA